jgi:hypothetical protein
MQKLATLLYILSLHRLVRDLEMMEARRKAQLQALVAEFVPEETLAGVFLRTLESERTRDQLTKLAQIVAYVPRAAEPTTLTDAIRGPPRPPRQHTSAQRQDDHAAV